ncbi:SMI1/KNR4 family protein [Microscilla marina]|uniref:Knr4/Smi1-like domain-containing protein n=1 Tax=Microscilla marina ATCC 23134 TaxID=313606 RepID=A1ZXJ3_MICM2|nr:SMI1/KNR4 family protein [Microscilla marina]EAY24868.1 hypothetical protein M23134_05843 [Microscilla marina ATCC 23134]
MMNVKNELKKNKVKNFSPPTIDSLELSQVQESINDKYYLKFLDEMNGGYFFNGSLHFYGVCADLPFHSIMNVNSHLRSCYKDLSQGIFSFGEDLFGNQFCFSKDGVILFNLESAEKEKIATNFEGFLAAIFDNSEDLDYYTGQSLMQEWQSLGHSLQYGERLCPKQPFIIGGEFEVENLHVKSFDKNLEYNSKIAYQISNLPDGTEIKITIES